MDENHDGQVSQEEFIEVLRRMEQLLDKELFAGVHETEKVLHDADAEDN